MCPNTTDRAATWTSSKPCRDTQVRIRVRGVGPPALFLLPGREREGERESFGSSRETEEGLQTRGESEPVREGLSGGLRVSRCPDSQPSPSHRQVR